MWGPAWVSWRSGGGYVGWAPMPPRGVRVPNHFGKRSAVAVRRRAQARASEIRLRPAETREERLPKDAHGLARPDDPARQVGRSHQRRPGARRPAQGGPTGRHRAARDAQARDLSQGRHTHQQPPLGPSRHRKPERAARAGSGGRLRPRPVNDGDGRTGWVGTAVAPPPGQRQDGRTGWVGTSGRAAARSTAGRPHRLGSERLPRGPPAAPIPSRPIATVPRSFPSAPSFRPNPSAADGPRVFHAGDHASRFVPRMSQPPAVA